VPRLKLSYDFNQALFGCFYLTWMYKLSASSTTGIHDFGKFFMSILSDIYCGIVFHCASLQIIGFDTYSMALVSANPRMGG
jgi:hypothetical protein